MRPKIKIELTTFDKILEGIGAAALLTMFGLIIINYSQLSDTIVTHFNASGEVDGHGSKSSIWISPVMSLATYIGITISQYFPHKLNYMVEITEENAERQYRNIILMTRLIKLCIAIMFLYLTNVIIQNALTGVNTLGKLFLPITLIGITGTIIIFIVRSFQLK